MRNTAPCILYASLKIQKENPNALIVVAPSDHWIEDESAFAADVQACFDAAEKDNILLTLGINPTFPNTGYGYIESDPENDSSIKNVIQFREKPDYETAKAFVEKGNFLWNAGIFIWSTKTILASFKNHLPAMQSHFEKGLAVLNTSTEKDFIDREYSNVENISIDYGILEKANNVYVKKANFDWNDLGTWGSLHDKLEKDSEENAIVSADTFLKDASGNMIFSKSDKLIVVDGLKDYIIVDKDDVLLLFPKKKEQEIKELIKEISDKFGVKYL